MLLDIFVDKRRMEMGKFTSLSENELLDVDGGVFGVDDAALVAAFLTAMAIGATVGVNRKNRS